MAPVTLPRSVSDAEIAALPGWFLPEDIALFRLLLAQTSRRLGGGDLAELGVYLGKSAVLVGSALGPEETLTVIDLFGEQAPSAANQAENTEQYPDLTRAAFEANYARLCDRPATVLTGPSASIVDHVPHGTHRFVHVDASHLYEHVVEDIAASRLLLKPGGVVVFDDFRTEHAPGVGAAVWQATHDGLIPFAVTPVKLYAAWDDSVDWAGVVRAWAETVGRGHEVQQVAGHDLVRLFAQATPHERPALGWRDFVPAVGHGTVSRAAAVARGLRARARSGTGGAAGGPGA